MNNPEEENNNSELKTEPDGRIVFNGSWENKGRSIAAAAFTGLIGIGAAYSYVQSFLYIIFISIAVSLNNTKGQGDYFEKLSISPGHYKIPILVALAVSQFCLLLIPALLIIKKWHTKDVVKYIRIRLVKVREIFLAVLITIFLIPVCSYISYLIMQLLRVPVSYQNAGPDLFTATNVTELIFVLVVVAITPAICEEILFRGYFQRTLERTMGFKSFIVTGIVFGLFHMQPLGLVSLSILGMLLSFLYYRSKSILPSSAAHFTNNFIVVLLYYYDSKVSVKDEILPENLPIVWIVFSFILAAVLIFLYIHLTKTKDGSNEYVKYQGAQN